MAELLNAVRRNHALEHATISILLGRLNQPTRIIGRSTGSGFHIYGRLPTAMLEQSAREGLARLRQGEAHLAISPLCGTNLVVAGLLSGLSSTLALGSKGGLTRLPSVMTSAMLAVLIAQPLGRLAQKYLTTSPDLSLTEIVSVRAIGKGLVPLHKVETAYHG